MESQNTSPALKTILLFICGILLGAGLVFLFTSQSDLFQANITDQDVTDPAAPVQAPEQPVVEEPVPIDDGREPVIEEPVVQEPVAEEPVVVEEPVVIEEPVFEPSGGVQQEDPSSSDGATLGTYDPIPLPPGTGLMCQDEQVIAQDSATVTLSVIDEGEPDPVCSNFTATPNPVAPNTAFTLSWNSERQARAEIYVSQNVVYTLNTEKQQVVPNGIGQDTTYTLRVYNSESRFVECETNVLVDGEEKSKTVQVTDSESGETTPPATSGEADEEDILTYALTVTNTTTAPIQNYVLMDDVSDILEYASISPQKISDGGTLGDDEIIRWNIAVLQPNTPVTRTFEAKVYDTALWPQDGDMKLINQFGNQVTVTLKAPPGSVDTRIAKTPVPTTAVAGQEITYTLTYENQDADPDDGKKIPATDVVIVDDFPEDIVELLSFPTEMCEEREIQNQNKVLWCEIDVLEVDGEHTLNYTVRVRNGVTTNIVNTATIDQRENDANPLDNTATATVTVQGPGGITLTKSASPTSVVQGQEVTFTVRVTNSTPQSKTFDLTDAITNISNGGNLEFVGLVSTTFSYENPTAIQGTYPNFTIPELLSGEYFEIVYKSKAVVTDIPNNQSSNITNTVTLSTGEQATATVTVRAPCTNCGGGGGGGSRVNARVNVDLIKQVYVDGEWHDADTFPMAQILKSQKRQTVPYRIIVENRGNIAAVALEVEDVFASDSMARLDIENVENAEWDEEDQVFTLGELKSNEKITIFYDATIERQVGAKELASGVNTATVLTVESPEDLPFRFRVRDALGIGESDPAFVRLGEETERPDVVLTKQASKNVVMPGEEFNYIIILRNVTEEDLLDVVLTERFPFEYLEYVNSNARGIEKDGQIQFLKRILRAGESWTIRITARVKATVKNQTKIRNLVTVAASNADLSDKNASTEVTVERQPNPGTLQRTGPEAIALILMMFGSMLVFMGVRRRFQF